MSSNPRNLNFLPPPPPTALSDTDLCAKWASEALAEGRIDLGLSLARLAAAARQAEQSATPTPILVPHLGSTRFEQPRATTFEAVAGQVDETDVRGPLSALSPEAQTQINTQLDAKYGQSDDPIRCGVPIDSSQYPCDESIFWQPDANRWLHTLAAVNEDHQARPR